MLCQGRSSTPWAQHNYTYVRSCTQEALKRHFLRITQIQIHFVNVHRYSRWRH